VRKANGKALLPRKWSILKVSFDATPKDFPASTLPQLEKRAQTLRGCQYLVDPKQKAWKGDLRSSNTEKRGQGTRKRQCEYTTERCPAEGRRTEETNHHHGTSHSAGYCKHESSEAKPL